MPLNHSILLVEDNPLDVDLTLRAFARRPCATPLEVVRDGEEALRLVARWEAGEPPPLLVLLDLKLPRVDGLDVLRAIRRGERTRAIPVVVLTTSNAERDVREAYDRGANSYVVKPVDFDRFVEVAALIDHFWVGANRSARTGPT